MFSHYATRKTSPICKISTFSEDLSFLNPRSHLKKQKFIEKGYKSDLDKQISTVEKLDQNEMLKAETKTHSTNINVQSLLSKHQ